MPNLPYDPSAALTCDGGIVWSRFHDHTRGSYRNLLRNPPDSLLVSRNEESLPSGPPVSVDELVAIMDDLIEIGYAAAQGTLMSSSHAGVEEEDPRRLHDLMVSSHLYLGISMLEATALCASKGKVAPTMALSRAGWEALLYCTLRHLRDPKSARDDLEYEGPQLNAMARGERRRLPDLEKPTNTIKLQSLHQHFGDRPPYVQFEEAYKFLYAEASQAIHGNLHGALSNIVDGYLGLANVRSKAHEIETTLTQLMATLEAVIQTLVRDLSLDAVLAHRAKACIARTN